jgi:polyhydroxyalkanoate synthase subunit PhaC
MTIDGMRLDLKKVMMPVYNLATREDHIAQAISAFLGAKFFGGPVKFVLSGSGHIAGVVNPVAKAKYQFWTGADIEGELEDWLAKATEHPGSWWPDWLQWLKNLHPETVPARQPGSPNYPPIEDAPGSYVKMKA